MLTIWDEKDKSAGEMERLGTTGGIDFGNEGILLPAAVMCLDGIECRKVRVRRSAPQCRRCRRESRPIPVALLQHKREEGLLPPRNVEYTSWVPVGSSLDMTGLAVLSPYPQARQLACTGLTVGKSWESVAPATKAAPDESTAMALSKSRNKATQKGRVNKRTASGMELGHDAFRRTSVGERPELS